MRPVIALFTPSPTDPERLVPPSGITAQLTAFAAGAMAFLAVFALALMFATNRVADRWSAELAQTATIRVSAPAPQMAEQVQSVLTILGQTPGVASARAMGDDEQRALLAPWFGPDLPVEVLPIPRLIEVVEDSTGIDAEGLRLRLRAEVPGAVLDDHGRWRRPLIEAAERLRTLGVLSIALIALTMAAMVTLAASASLSANGKVIAVLRLVGARDSYVIRAFVRRFMLRALAGASVGTVFAMAAIAVFPDSGRDTGFLTGLGFRGLEWFVPLLIPPVAAMVAFWATRIAAARKLREIR
ncbi:MAG: cell division protein FtsX [Rhodobacteraceae bacterium]|nr:cell division protein FtsX [Paracoccaceae bacterium]